MWLTEKQVESLTRKKRPSAQMQVLRESLPPIPFTVVDGRPIVLKEHISEVKVSSSRPSLVLIK